MELKPGGYFKDAIGHWAESSIQLLYQADIINGSSATTFNPNGQVLEEYGLIDIFDGSKFEPKKLVTREEIAYVTTRYSQAMEVDLSQVSNNNTFTDKNQMRKETVEAIGILQQLGILNGTNGKFNPKGNLTRAEVSKILTLALMKLSDEK
ncbi:S-layer homology domain-containing protein [Lysinibacillus fusiformis]|uniref:S-layer homology domain-containing protein n=1 Tax=Lysinibacillus fusiformis TaxID=28031 RepID=UPI0035C19362|nr:S-layer homology domain-containing protein [Lysinibacillus fusiformis]